MVAVTPRSSLGKTLFGRLVQICPPRRLGSSLKLALRRSIGVRTALSCMNRRVKVLRAPSRLIDLLMVTRTVCPLFRSNAIGVSDKEGGVYRRVAETQGFRVQGKPRRRLFFS